jgi:subtilase family serine protease
VTFPNPTGLGPATVNGYYHLHPGGKGQVIMVVVGEQHPNVAGDLAVFSTRYHLPQLGTCNPAVPLSQQSCFSIAEPEGTPASDPGDNWSLESDLDVQWAHAEAPLASIVLVESLDGNEQPPAQMLGAIKWADLHGATEVSMSWGNLDQNYTSYSDRYFHQPGVLYIASAGDEGHIPYWPAASPYVIGVGGTTFNGCSGAVCGIITESAWSASGGAAATNDTLPAFQSTYTGPVDGASTISALTAGHRGIPDVGFLANPSTGVSVYDSEALQPYGDTGWETVGGTSLGAPAWAGILASGQAGGLKALEGTANLYATGWKQHLRNVTTGSNGSCGVPCNAGPGYDLITGLGTPYSYP